MDHQVLWIILVITFSISVVNSGKIDLTTLKSKVERTTAKADSISTTSSGTREVTTNTTYPGSNGNLKPKFECVVFYECDHENVVDSSKCGERECEEIAVCCATSVPENLDRKEVPILAPKAPPTPINLNSNSTQQPVNESCICVPFYHCMPSESETNPRTSECRSSSEVCCTEANLHPDTTSTTSSGMNKVIRNTTRPGTNENPKLNCKCVLFYECDSENVVDTSMSDERFQCEDDVQVCCRIPEYESEPIPVPAPANEQCTCVPFYYCAATDEPYGINPTIQLCESETEVCCLTANLYSNTERHSLP